MYIKFVNEENKYIFISIWLMLITLLVALMIVVGGLTRLTDSGLSITQWELVSGIIPPFTSEQWDKYFSLYKKIPEYQLINSSMTLDQFKVIFWWEYIHRLLGRLIGLVYFIPLVYFSWKRSFNKKKLISLYSIFILILMQGFIGWYMVQSGLTERTDVSHYRLSLHLTLAFIIYILLLWNYMNHKDESNLMGYKKIPYFLPFIFLILLIAQISLGALVSGLDAGKIYPTWPLMNESYFPDDTNFKDLFYLKSLESPSLVQFLHRNLAYLIFFLFLFMSILVFKNNEFYYLRKFILIIFFLILLQIFLGIFTILSDVNILIASMHQIGSIILVSAALILVFKNSKIN